MRDLEKRIEEMDKIADTIDIPVSMERYKIAVEIQRNKILQEGLDNIYDILDDIRYNREH